MFNYILVRFLKHSFIIQVIQYISYLPGICTQKHLVSAVFRLSSTHEKEKAVSIMFVKTDFSLKTADGRFPLVLILLSTKFFIYAHTYIKKTDNIDKLLKDQRRCHAPTEVG